MSVPTPPDSDSITAVLTWVIAACFTGFAAVGGAFMWLIGRFSHREEKVIGPLTDSVDNMAESLGEVARTVDTVGDHLKTANQLEHDRQLLSNQANDR